ncbi:hypothetical protein CF326_g7733 [Tilletia indica]|nr:hypothetical protein CF326_g7733 [Tilletia indica]
MIYPTFHRGFRMMPSTDTLLDLSSIPPGPLESENSGGHETLSDSTLSFIFSSFDQRLSGHITTEELSGGISATRLPPATQQSLQTAASQTSGAVEGNFPFSNLWAHMPAPTQNSRLEYDALLATAQKVASSQSQSRPPVSSSARRPPLPPPPSNSSSFPSSQSLSHRTTATASTRAALLRSTNDLTKAPDKDEHGARPGIGFPEFSRIP